MCYIQRHLQHVFFFNKTLNINTISETAKSSNCIVYALKDKMTAQGEKNYLSVDIKELIDPSPKLR